MSDVREVVRGFISNNFLLDPATQLTDGDSLLQLQIVDSTGFLELVNFIETTFALKVADDEMVPENLESVDNIVMYVNRKRATPA